MIPAGDSTSSEVVVVVQASELLPQIVDEKYPGPGKVFPLIIRVESVRLEENAISSIA